jgi:lysophospholipase L1-like esterase
VISCPAPAFGQSFDGNPAAVAFGAPTVTGGVAPVATNCGPALFPVGTTKGTCTARDAKQQVATCSFSVSVVKVPQILATKFVAFGDSITEGVTATCQRTITSMSFAETMLVLPKGANDPWTYPNVLQSMLRSTYTAQSPSVSNRGVGGEELSTGVVRFPSVLTADTPQVALLQEGANDVNQGRSPQSIAGSLRAMVREAKNRGVQVYVGTLLPQRRLGVSGSCRGFGADDVATANDQIRSMVASEGVPLVDLYLAYGGVPGDLIGADGLHPSEAGYQKIAESFFTAIKQRLEK